MKITKQEHIFDDQIQLAQDYKYIDATTGSVGVSAISREDAPQLIVVHATNIQFHPIATPEGNGTKAVNCALGSIVMEYDSAKTLYKLLGQMLDISDK